MKKKARQFSKSSKDEVVALVLDGRRTVPEVCEQHKLHTSSVYAWVRQAKIDAGSVETSSATMSEEEELARLRSEVRELKRENDFLRDAASYFARAKK